MDKSDYNEIDAIAANRQRLIDTAAEGRERAVKDFARDHGLVVDGDWSHIPLDVKTMPKCQAAPATEGQLKVVLSSSRGASGDRSL